MGQVKHSQDQILSSVTTLCTKLNTLIDTRLHIDPSRVATSTQGPGYVPTGSRADNRNIPSSVQASVPLTTTLDPRITRTVPQEIAPANNRVCINLDGQDIYFDKSDLPDPPAVHFSDNISALFREWHESRRLVVAGHGIPIKYWDKLYQKRNGFVNTDAWRAIKVEWGNWKFLVDEHARFPTDEAFWDAHSNEKGERMSYQHILDKLQHSRCCTDDADYSAAIQYFQGNLEHPDARGAFKYKKGGVWRVASRKLVVARIWRKLLEQDPEVRAKWVAMQVNGPPGE
ncbi:uncharacterized protein C8Q71DRAFT_703190 [Rhodofomes roseus]|uniref:Uncharacterized protein n=1 Tax=Rhodofomes roseus TaxID=34475 RepID=A0ABQ8KNW0_9APHY|nr:uncharacterized protein C8Q71DRAFT_703190 [Rhodofomes roseus]KAH9840011.1 hypothetical protein C8Q71DRAFT_703190 [Rhodofomes roseus]